MRFLWELLTAYIFWGKKFNTSKFYSNSLYSLKTIYKSKKKNNQFKIPSSVSCVLKNVQRQNFNGFFLYWNFIITKKKFQKQYYKSKILYKVYFLLCNSFFHCVFFNFNSLREICVNTVNIFCFPMKSMDTKSSDIKN